MKLSDYVVSFIADQGVKHVFMLPGGGAMHLNDSLGASDRLQYVCNLHEQATAIAAEAYARVSRGLGVAMVTTGPGSTNTVTGVAAAWLDSTPVMFVSGQVKRADLKTGTALRMLGVQEIDIVSIVGTITKYAVTITDPSTIRFHLEKALWLAMHGRRGPVWIDIPLDVQAMQIEPASQQGFIPPPDDAASRTDVRAAARDTLAMLRDAKRPVILAGNGVRMAGGERELLEVAERHGIPVLTTWLGHDLIGDDHPLFFGRPGGIAPRFANFTLQNSDLLLIVGARMDMALTAYAHEKLARDARKIMVDVDGAEIEKMKTPIHLPVVADAAEFLRALLTESNSPVGEYDAWRARCRDWKARYPLVLPEHRERTDALSMYHFADVLSDELSASDVIAPGSSGFACEIFLLVAKVKHGQRLYHNRGTGAMGFGLPSSIGACVASGRRTIMVDGDGGFQMNIQELATVASHRLPIKMFVVNNGGYASIRASQQAYFGRLVAADATSGLQLPDVTAVAKAYGLATARINSPDGLRDQIRAVLAHEGPIVCEVRTPDDEPRGPRVSSMQRPDGSMVSKPLEDLWPFLDRDEFFANMITAPLPE
jgi:acetolactate synthase-1/2/3 large subunit